MMWCFCAPCFRSVPSQPPIATCVRCHSTCVPMCGALLLAYSDLFAILVHGQAECSRGGCEAPVQGTLHSVGVSFGLCMLTGVCFARWWGTFCTPFHHPTRPSPEHPTSMRRTRPTQNECKPRKSSCGFTTAAWSVLCSPPCFNTTVTPTSMALC